MAKKKQKTNEVDRKKLLFEIIAVPLCIFYLYYTYISSNKELNTILLYIVIIVTSIEFNAKYIKELYIYENKYNFLRIIYTVFSLILLVSIALNIFVKTKLTRIIFVVLAIVLITYLLIYAIFNIKKLLKKEGEFSKTVLASFLSLASFFTSLAGLIIYLK